MKSRHECSTSKALKRYSKEVDKMSAEEKIQEIKWLFDNMRNDLPGIITFVKMVVFSEKYAKSPDTAKGLIKIMETKIL
ncbi:hypothetical protein MCHI_002201 [Candidatus Magnetoovum chiemensis]|nr:hypothetical protein MCHI_002201 [Candidatus Magnetoovum chiemensis]